MNDRQLSSVQTVASQYCCVGGGAKTREAVEKGTYVGSKFTRSTITFWPDIRAARTAVSTSCRRPKADSSCEHRTQPGLAATSAFPNVVFPDPGRPTSIRSTGCRQYRVVPGILHVADCCQRELMPDLLSPALVQMGPTAKVPAAVPPNFAGPRAEVLLARPGAGDLCRDRWVHPQAMGQP